MKPYLLSIYDMSRTYSNGEVVSFVARDSSGSFGIQCGHQTFVTCLRPGIARFADVQGQWHYVAQPGSVLVFMNSHERAENHLRLSTSQFVMSTQRDALLDFMDSEWQALDRDAGRTKRNIVQVEQALARKLWEMNRGGEAL